MKDADEIKNKNEEHAKEAKEGKIMMYKMKKGEKYLRPLRKKKVLLMKDKDSFCEEKTRQLKEKE